MECFAEDEHALLNLARRVATKLVPGDVMYLQGNLGAGKTTFAKGVLHGLGYGGHVKSPTFTLVEPYGLAVATVYHWDLYRLSTPQELFDMGVEDYFHADAIHLIEWPKKGVGVIPASSLEVSIVEPGEGRAVVLTTNNGGARFNDLG